MRFGKPVVVAGVCALAVAALGGVMTETGTWYARLSKSSLTPPDWAFGPAWMVIYALAVVSAARGWQQARTSRQRSWLLSLFFVNALLNVLWSAVFFTLQRPDWALAEVATLWLSVAVLILFLGPISRPASLLLVPYLVWVSFAAFLNLRVVQLNAPFG